MLATCSEVPDVLFIVYAAKTFANLKCFLFLGWDLFTTVCGDKLTAGVDIVVFRFTVRKFWVFEDAMKWRLTFDPFQFIDVNFKAWKQFEFLIIYYPRTFLHQKPRNWIMRHYPPLRVSLINDVPQGKTCAHDSYQNFIQWLSLIFLLWNKNFLTKFLNSIISLDLKSAVNWSTFDIQTSLFAFITSSIKWQTLIWCDLSANPLVVDIFSEELSTKIYDIITIFSRGTY